MIILEDFALITNKKYYSIRTELSALSTELEDIQPGQEQPPVAGAWARWAALLGGSFRSRPLVLLGKIGRGPCSSWITGMTV